MMMAMVFDGKSEGGVLLTACWAKAHDMPGQKRSSISEGSRGRTPRMVIPGAPGFTILPVLCIPRVSFPGLRNR